jgi:excisionase family DNA binding protein
VKTESTELTQSDVLTVEQVQQRLGISRGTVYNLLKRNLLERAYIGEVVRRTLITRESVDRLAQAKKT